MMSWNFGFSWRPGGQAEIEPLVTYQDTPLLVTSLVTVIGISTNKETLSSYYNSCTLHVQIRAAILIKYVHY